MGFIALTDLVTKKNGGFPACWVSAKPEGAYCQEIVVSGTQPDGQEQVLGLFSDKLKY